MRYASFILATFIVFSLFISVYSVNAQEASSEAVQSGYDLPYPGLLPNQPLYFLKAFRDEIQGFFISDPLQKADFDILQADKHVQASLLLSRNPKTVPLSESTLSKGENYFEDAINKTSLARKQGMDIKEVTKHLEQSNEKHQEVIRQIQQTVGTDKKSLFQNDYNRAVELSKKANSLK